jgi:hypothetical protein
VLVCDRPVRDYVAAHPHMGTPGRSTWWIRRRIVAMAHRMVGVEYSWLDYLAIAMAEWKVPGWQAVRAGSSPASG